MKRCRGCDKNSLQDVFGLGPMPLPNRLPATAALALVAPRFPLSLCVCDRCSLVQIPQDTPPETLFSDYTYFSSISRTMVDHARELAALMVRDRSLDSNSWVVELASNDGYLLQHYVDKGIPVLGVEPARNVAAVAESRGIPTVVDFFGEDLGRLLGEGGQRADVIHAHNVLAHVPDPGSFLRGISALLKDDGIACIEVPHVAEMIDRNEFDTIYHEHLCYFSFTALARLLLRNGLSPVHVERSPIHGGSLRILAGRSGAAPDETVAEMLRWEDAWNVRSIDTYRAFSERASGIRDELVRFADGLRAAGKTFAAYGASAKGCVMMNYAGLRNDDVAFVVDKSPHKQGRFVPGAAIPIVEPGRLLSEMPDFVLLTVWNIEREILAQEAEYRRRGGRFVTPIPSMRMSS